MAAGKSNKAPWADQMDNLPIQAGSSFDKGAAWEKLHHRLYGKKEKRRGFGWIGWTTVSVAASVILLLFLNSKTTKKQIESIIVSGSEIKTIVPAEKKEQQLPLEKTKDNLVIDKNRTTHIVTAHPNTNKKEEPQNKEGAQMPETNVYTAIPPAIDTSVSATALTAIPTAAIKKRLKVVHNNELGGAINTLPVDQKNTVAKNQGGFFPGFHRPVFENEDHSDDTVRRIKPKRSILPFSSLISQKE